MSPLKAFIKNPERTKYAGEDADEKILYILRASVLTLIPWAFALVLSFFAPFFFKSVIDSSADWYSSTFTSKFWLVTSVFWYLALFGATFQFFLNWYFNVYVITNKKLVDFDFMGVLYKNISETSINNIEDVTSTIKGSLGIVFNIGDVFIQTAGEKPEFDFMGIDDPSKIRDIISDLVVAEKKHGRPNN